MKKILLSLTISLCSLWVDAQSTILKASSLNKMMDLVLHDSVSFSKEKKRKMNMVEYIIYQHCPQWECTP